MRPRAEPSIDQLNALTLAGFGNPRAEWEARQRHSTLIDGSDETAPHDGGWVLPEPPPHTEIPDSADDRDQGDHIVTPGRKAAKDGAWGQTSALPPLKLSYFETCDDTTAKPALLKGLLVKGETSSWFGPPGSGKSALITEIAVHLGEQRDWRGHKAKERCAVLIIALERADLYRRRLRAYQLRDGMKGRLPIAIAAGVVNLMDRSSVDVIIKAAEEVEKITGCPSV